MPRHFLAPFLLMLLGLASCAALRPEPATQGAPQLPPAAAPPAATPALPPPPPLAAEPAPAEEQPFFTQEGVASFYGKAHQGKRTAAGERFDRTQLTAAHRTLAFGTVVRVTNLRNGTVVKVRINDRGPHVKGRVIDLSSGAARALGIRDGLAPVRVEAFSSDQAESGAD